MSVGREQLLNVLREQISHIPEEERCPKYQDDLLYALADIVGLESAHREKKTDVVVSIRAKCEALGDLLLQGGWKP